MLAGAASYDALGEQEQALVREGWADRMVALRNEIEDEISLNLYDSGAASKQYLQILERRFRANWNVDAEAKSAGPAEPVHVIFADAPEAERGAL